MHKSSYLRMKYLVEYYKVLFQNPNERKIQVLDIGSCNMNGAYRDIFAESEYQYTGLDMASGDNVDIVPQDIYRWDEIEDDTFDLVISGQVFEHIEFPWLTIKEVARVLKPSGVCIVIAPNSGVEHKAPKDCYRYFSDGLVALAKWANLTVQHVSVGGIPKLTETEAWISDWNDGCLVAQKEPSQFFAQGSPFERECCVPVFGYSDTYRIWEMAVWNAYEKFGDKKPVALFGAAWIGEVALEVLGNDRVRFFIENSPYKIGKEFRGKKIISFDEYKKESNRYNCLITASYKASLEIRKQLEQAGISSEMLYRDKLYL